MFVTKFIKPLLAQL